MTLIGLGGCATDQHPAPGKSRGGAADPASHAANIASRQVGTPYRYGGNSPSGFDCSGLVQYSYAMAGVNVPRTTGALWQTTTPVSRSEIQAGDVLFFRVDGKMSHVGLYLGSQKFVHAPSSGRAVSIATLTSPYYAKAFVGAGRLE
jgi:cell wall-associated NlpC family hydrolase